MRRARPHLTRSGPPRARLNSAVSRDGSRRGRQDGPAAKRRRLKAGFLADLVSAGQVKACPTKASLRLVGHALDGAERVIRRPGKRSDRQLHALGINDVVGWPILPAAGSQPAFRSGAHCSKPPDRRLRARLATPPLERLPIAFSDDFRTFSAKSKACPTSGKAVAPPAAVCRRLV